MSYLTFSERLRLAKAEKQIAELELDAALMQAVEDRDARIERGWDRLLLAVLNETGDREEP